MGGEGNLFRQLIGNFWEERPTVAIAAYHGHGPFLRHIMRNMILTPTLRIETHRDTRLFTLSESVKQLLLQQKTDGPVDPSVSMS